MLAEHQRSQRPVLRFSLLALFACILVVSVPLAWQARQRDASRRERLARIALARVSPHVTYGRDREIYLAIREPITLNLSEKPLQDVVDTIAKQLGIPIYIDRRALDDVGLSPNMPSTLVSTRMSLDGALHRYLTELELTYVIQNGVLVITTPEEAETDVEVRVYNVADLLADDETSESLASALGKVLEDPWASPSSKRDRYRISAYEHLLLVHTSGSGHREFVAVLEMLRSGIYPID